jgi:putative SOS response-associated peptidase YedK
MCGRFSLSTSGAALAEQFALPEVPELAPRYNIAPTQPVAAVRAQNAPASETGSPRTLTLLRWGLVPHWARDPSIGGHMFNARAETVAEKPAFRAAFTARRCLVLADGFYEWQAAASGPRKGHKQPFFIHMQDQRPFAMAGLWEHWQAGDQVIESCTIITTEPNDLVASIHSRMPVIVAPDAYALWLDPQMQQPEPLLALLRPYPAAAMASYPVSRTVNNVRNEVPECRAPLS